MKLLALLALAVACAPVPETAPSPLPPQAIRCAQNGATCLRIHVDNQLAYQGIFWLNGVRLGEVEPWGTADFWFDESQLVEGRCAYASAGYRLPGFVLRDQRQCIRAGERFNIVAGVEGKLWLEPKRMDQP